MYTDIVFLDEAFMGITYITTILFYHSLSSGSDEKVSVAGMLYEYAILLFVYR